MSFLKNNWHWMLFALIIFGGIGVVLFTQLNTDTEPERKFNYTEPEAPIANKPPRDARPGFKWVQHDDHWHEVPVAQAEGAEQHNAPQESIVQPVQTFEPEQPQSPAPRQEGVWKEGINGEKLYFPPHPPFETYAHLLKDPEATIRKNAAIIVADYYSKAANYASRELNLINLAIHKGYVGGSMWSDEAIRLSRLLEEVLYKPLEEKGILGPAPPVPSAHEGGENQ